jgi:hypothetical protein
MFDYNGAWSEPFARNGWNVIMLDKKHGFDIMQISGVDYVFEEMGVEECHGIIAAPPCTKYAVSGAKHWKKFDAIQKTLFGDYDPMEVYDELVSQTLRMVNLFTPTDPEYGDEEGQTWFWALENPVGRIAKRFPELGSAWYFDPFEFAGYLEPSKAILKKLDAIRKKNGHGITDLEAELIYNTEVYSKHTGLWGNFNSDLIKKPIAKVNGAPSGTVLQRAGGKSDKTKEYRSNTPYGFAQAFYEANHAWTGFRDQDIIID